VPESARQDRQMRSTPSAAHVDHLPALTDVTAEFARTLTVVPLDATPAALRRWTVADLAAHLGEVRRWAAATVETAHRAVRVNRP
jgi:Mycothiol maleylpyruvate isomerase N-terminal domain